MRALTGIKKRVLLSATQSKIHLMPRLRLLCAVFLLVFAPLSGAFAAAHHHCHDVWHGHAQNAVAADEDCDSHAPNLALTTCEECQAAFAAVPFAAAILSSADGHVPAAQDMTAALAHHVFSLFRPPKA